MAKHQYSRPSNKSIMNQAKNQRRQNELSNPQTSSQPNQSGSRSTE